MIMSPALRRLVLTAHITASVGWLGAAAAYLVLAVDVMASQDARTVRATVPAMESIVWYVVVPFAFASLLTGLVQALGTAWGLFRHYWVITKLLINVGAVTVLLEYTGSLAQLTDVATKTTLTNADLRPLTSPDHAIHAGGGLVLLLVATVLAVYKPPGMTRYGRRKQREQRVRSRAH
jgi:hypothetical protein